MNHNDDAADVTPMMIDDTSNSAVSNHPDDGATVTAAAGANKKSKVRGPWSPEEDVVLSELVSKFGARNWSLIARGIPGRSGKSCRLRWCNQLDPSVQRKPFTGMFNPVLVFKFLRTLF